MAAPATVAEPELAFRNGSTGRRRAGGLLLRAALLAGAVLAAALLLRGARSSPFFGAAVNASGVARNSTVHATSHRVAVADRMYNGALHQDFLGSLQLLDHEVRHRGSVLL